MQNKFKLLLLTFCLAFFNAWSEAPYMINYQGIARSASGVAISNQTIAIRASILQSGIGGTILYSEVRNLTTDAEGLFNFKINGPGATSVTGIFSSINWSNGGKYLQIELDANGGSNFINMGTQQLVSVPYAQLANKADGLTPYGQMSIGAVAGDVIQFDGTNWKAATPIDGVALPFLATDPNLVSFAISNTSALGGTAITGTTTTNHANATGIKGEATASSLSGTGVLGKGNSVNSIGVHGKNTLGIAIKGSTATTSSSIPAVLGECTGTTGIGIEGNSQGATGIGVYGESASGVGVKGYSNNIGSVAVYGSSLAGTGVQAYSFTGNALEVIGNVKISGGTVSPTSGAILTSDAQGNAVWDPNTKVAFRGHNVSQTSTSGTPNHEFSENVFKKVEFFSEEHDLHGDFSPTGANAASANSSTFLAPVHGIYHFDAAVSVETNNLFDYISFTIRLVRKRGSSTSVIAESLISGASNIGSTVHISTDRSVLVGDRIWVEYKQTNYSLLSSDLKVEERGNFFTGHLVYQQ
ncbi:MAG TPA: hypothetical protein PLU17_13535 [Chitinophagaceae bacterium]|nr:hypothetical protein [Chitinophagaceae bacterium]